MIYRSVKCYRCRLNIHDWVANKWLNCCSVGKNCPGMDYPYFRTGGDTEARDLRVVWGVRMRLETYPVLNMNWWPDPCWKVHKTCSECLPPPIFRNFLLTKTVTQINDHLPHGGVQAVHLWLLFLYFGSDHYYKQVPIVSLPLSRYTLESAESYLVVVMS